MSGSTRERCPAGTDNYGLFNPVLGTSLLYGVLRLGVSNGKTCYRSRLNSTLKAVWHPALMDLRPWSGARRRTS